MELKLTINSAPFKTLRRKFYRVDYFSHTTLIFMTTNEYDESFNDRALDHDFEIYTDIQQIFDGFRVIIDLDIFHPSNKRYRGIPNFIYYDIVSVQDAVYLQFKLELMKAVEGFQLSDFDIYEKQRIDKWLMGNFNNE